MGRKRKKKSEEKIIPLPPKTEIKDIVEEKIVEEEMIEEYKDYVHVLELGSPPSPEPPKTKKIKYLGVDVLITRGPVTGQRYRFTAKNRISEVAIEDYEGLLGKASRAHRCCGRKEGDPGRTVSGQSYFGPV